MTESGPLRHDLSGTLCCVSRRIIVWRRTFAQRFALVRMILYSWMTTIPCLSFRIQEDRITSRPRQVHPHLSHLLISLWTMTLPLTYSLICAAHLPRSTQNNHHPPSKFDMLVSCHRFIRQHLPTVRKRSTRYMRVLQSHILFGHIPETHHNWDPLQQALTRQSSVLQSVLQLWRQPQRRNRENASVATGKAVITKLRVWMIWRG